MHFFKMSGTVVGLQLLPLAGVLTGKITNVPGESWGNNQNSVHDSQGTEKYVCENSTAFPKFSVLTVVLTFGKNWIIAIPQEYYCSAWKNAWIRR